MPRPKQTVHKQNVALTIDPVTLARARQILSKRGGSLSAQVERLLNRWIWRSKEWSE